VVEPQQLADRPSLSLSETKLSAFDRGFGGYWSPRQTLRYDDKTPNTYKAFTRIEDADVLSRDVFPPFRYLWSPYPTAHRLPLLEGAATRFLDRVGPTCLRTVSGLSSPPSQVPFSGRPILYDFYRFREFVVTDRHMPTPPNPSRLFSYTRTFQSFEPRTRPSFVDVWVPPHSALYFNYYLPPKGSLLGAVELHDL